MPGELQGFSNGFNLYTFPGSVELMRGKLDQLSELKFVSGVVNSENMLTVRQMYEEFASQMSFGDYFGRNPSAFAACISDLDLTFTSPGVIVAISNVQLFLSEEPDSEIAEFVDVMDFAFQVWAEPIEQGDIFDRPAMSFHAVLCAGDDEVQGFRRRLENGGRTVEFRPFDL